MVKTFLSAIFIAAAFVNANAKTPGDESKDKKAYEVVAIQQIQVPTTGFIHPGLFLFRASLAVGGMTKLKAKNVFVEGNMEYFLDRKISIRGDGYFFATHYSDYKPFKMHHSLFTGAMYHCTTKGDFDPYFGLEVGINYAEATDVCLGGTCTSVVPPEPVSKVFSPLFSPVLGFNYYGGKFFHLSIHTRYIVGKFMDNYNSTSLGEWRLSFGLGFNISKKLLGPKMGDKF